MSTDTDMKERRPVPWRALLPAVLVLVVSLLATGVSVLAQRASILAAERVRFQSEHQVIGDAITDVMQVYIGVMRAGVGLMHAGRDIDAPAWHTFVATLELDTEFPGIQGVGYAEVVSRSVADGGDMAGASGDMRTVIRYIAPDDARNQRAIGFDMSSEEVRRLAMVSARDAGRPIMTGPVTLIQETAANPPKGVLIYLPLYQTQTVPATVDERRRTLRGYVYSAFRINDLMLKALLRRNQDIFRNLRLRLYDGPTANAAALIFDSASDGAAQPAAAQDSLFRATETVVVAGRAWTAVMSATPEFERNIDWSRLGMQLAGGFVISLLMAAIVAGLGLGRTRLLADAALLSDEVERRRKAQQQAQLANRELIHRVKNTLAIVNAIASQTARHSRTMPDFMRAFRERLAALGRVHDLLRPDRAGDPGFRRLVEETLSAYRPVTEQALRIDGPDVTVARDDAVLLSLFLNELAANAMKYGAWSVSRGRVAISWEIVGDDDSRQLLFRWRETDGPRIVGTGQSGFGTSVIRFAVERSLGGQVKLSYPEAGADHEIRLPWGKAVLTDAPYGQIANKAM